MVVTLLPTAALAADWSSVAVGGIGFNYGSESFINITMPTTDGSYTYGTCTTMGETTTAAETAFNQSTLPDSGWNWAVQKHASPVNGANYTLTLKNFNLNYEGTGDALMFKCNLNLVLKGTNVINAPSSGSAVSGNTYCSLAISGDGSIDVTGKSRGINVSGANATLSISDSVTITATATGDTVTNTTSYGIFCFSSVTISGSAKVTATGGTATGNNGTSYGIYGGNNGVAISGGTVKAIGGTATGSGGRSFGIYGGNDAVTISGGTVMAKGDSKVMNKAPTMSDGYSASQSFKWVSDNESAKEYKYTTSVTADSFGRYLEIVPAASVPANPTLFIGGEPVTANNQSGKGWSYDSETNTLTLNNLNITGTRGIEKSGDLIMKLRGANTVDLSSQTSGNSSYAVQVGGSLTIEGNTGSNTDSLTATAGTATILNAWSAGIYARQSLAITNASVVAIGNPAPNTSCGIIARYDSAQYSFTVSNNTVCASTNDSDTGCRALYDSLSTIGSGMGALGSTDYTGVTGLNIYDVSGNLTYKYVKMQPAKMAVKAGTANAALYADFATGWNAAVGASTTTVKLLADWTATSGSFGTGVGFGGGGESGTGYIRVPTGKTITLDLNGKTIDRALTSAVGTTEATAGWVIGDYGTLTIKDSSTDNVENQGKITGGYNSYSSFSAGGIFVAQNNSSTLTINGGNITGNKALHWGGGVYAGTNSTFTMTGGKISGNTAGSGGGGVYVGGTFNVGGTAKVTGNTLSDGTTANNVYLPTNYTVACSTTTPLTTGASIGVTTETAPSAVSPVAITSSNGSYDYSGKFFSDSGSYSIVNDAADTNAQVVKLALRSATPTATIATVAKTAATQASVAFTLTNSPAYANSQTWKVYSGSTGDTPASGVTASNVGNTLTLTHASDIAAGTYYVSVTETDKAESARLALTVGAYAAPSSGGSSSPTYSVTNGTASTAGGSVTLDKTNATSGSTVKITSKANDGYEVDTITVKDANGKTVTVTKNTDGTFRFTMPSGKVTVTATFKKIETPWVNPFTDVAEGDTFYDAIRYANENGLFEGTSATTFSPNAPMTRAMLWTVLGRLDGQTLSGSGVFDRAKAWATGSGITDGSNPSGLISRQQLITILWRYAGSPAPTGNLDAFSDAGSVADYAKDAMAWAVENGIVGGSNGKLMPANPATRGQVAAIAMRYAQLAAK